MMATPHRRSACSISPLGFSAWGNCFGYLTHYTVQKVDNQTYRYTVYNSPEQFHGVKAPVRLQGPLCLFSVYSVQLLVESTAHMATVSYTILMLIAGILHMGECVRMQIFLCTRRDILNWQ